jgi:hypothetical protein
MSYGAACRTHFSPEQQSRAVGTLINLRSNLIAPPGLNVTWANFNYIGANNGSFNEPYDNLTSAINAVNVGGQIVIKSSGVNQPFTITKALTLDSFRGIATLGQQ